jgi:hypothetical protein
MTQFENALAEAKAVIGERINPEKGAIGRDRTFGRIRFRAQEGSSVYLYPPPEGSDTWRLQHERKTIATGPLDGMIPHLEALGWLLESTPEPAPEPAPVPVQQLTLSDVLRGWELAVSHYIGAAIGDLLRSAKLPHAEQSAALQDAARNIDLALAELAR